MIVIFKCLLNKVCIGEVNGPFRVNNVIGCIGTSKSFLWKHSKNNPKKKVIHILFEFR
jgi:hypothetical protein